MSCGADTEGNELLVSLTSDTSFPIPIIDLTGPEFQIPGGINSDLYKLVKPVSIADLATDNLDGSAAFDVLMRASAAHLRSEYDAGRITGGEYTKAYISMVQVAMQTAASFLVERDRGFWAAVTAQVAAITARIDMVTARIKVASMQYQANEQRANYALAKMRLANESIEYCIKKFNLDNMLPVNLRVAELQEEGARTANLSSLFTYEWMLPLQKETAQKNLEMLMKQIAGAALANQAADHNVQFTLPKNYEIQGAQLTLLNEQGEAQRAQTLDTRKDGSTVMGTVGKQKALYGQQIISYQRDVEMKAAKLFTDAWTVMKTIDEGLLPPNGFTNANLDTVLSKVQANALS